MCGPTRISVSFMPSSLQIRWRTSTSSVESSRSSSEMIHSRSHPRARPPRHCRHDGAPGAHRLPQARRPRRSSRSAPTALPAERCRVHRRRRAPGSGARLDDLTADVGRWLLSRCQRLQGSGLPRPARRRPACTRRRPSACSGRSSSPRSSAHSLWFGLGASPVARPRFMLLATVGGGRARLDAPDVRRRLSARRNGASRSSGPSRPDRPPRRDARGRAQLPAVAPPRRGEDQASRSRPRSG